MKKVFLFPALMAAILFASCGGSSTVSESGTAASATAGAITYAIDSASSNVEWLAKKVTGQHNGTVTIKSGQIQSDSGKLAAGKFVMDMNSIVVLDLPATDEYNAKLLGHLKSDDFFSVEKNPEAAFEIVSATPIAGAAAGAANYTVTGNLTIKGISKAVTFPATITMTATDVTAKAEFDIDRTQWDIKFGSGKFFPDLGDKMINDAFTVKFNITAKASAPVAA